MRKLLLAACVLGATTFFGAPTAQAHCPTNFVGGDTDVVIYSGEIVTVNPGVAGCTVDDIVWTGGHGPGSDTNVIVPGSSYVSVGYVVESATAPTGTFTANGGLDITACDAFDPRNFPDPTPSAPGGTCNLTWTAGDDLDMDTIPDAWFAQTMRVARLSTSSLTSVPAGGSGTASVTDGSGTINVTYPTI